MHRFGFYIIVLVMILTWQISVAGMAAVKTDATGISHPSLQDLSFLCGTWKGQSASGAFAEEHWSKPHGDSIIGNCRFIKDGKTTFFELLAIVSTPAGIVLRMRHFNAAFIGWNESDEAGDCLLTRCTPSEVVFDNNSNTKRVTVTYRRVSKVALQAVVEERQDGKTSTYPFDYSLAE